MYFAEIVNCSGCDAPTWTGGCISRGKNWTKLDKTRYFGLGGRKVRCKQSKTRSREKLCVEVDSNLFRRSLVLCLFVISRRCRHVSRVSQTKRNMKALRPNLVILSSSLRRDDGRWDRRGRSLGGLICAGMIACSSQPMNCHFLCFISRIPLRDRSETLTGRNPESN